MLTVLIIRACGERLRGMPRQQGQSWYATGRLPHTSSMYSTQSEEAQLGNILMISLSRATLWSPAGLRKERTLWFPS